MLDGLRNIFIESLKFCKSKLAYDILVEKWNKECEEVYKYKQSLIAEEQAKHTPTADVVEVKHGEWIYKYRHRGGFVKRTGYDEFGNLHTITVDDRFEIHDPYCSVCGKLGGEFLSYCGNCGAKMDGGKNE